MANLLDKLPDELDLFSFLHLELNLALIIILQLIFEMLAVLLSFLIFFHSLKKEAIFGMMSLDKISFLMCIIVVQMLMLVLEKYLIPYKLLFAKLLDQMGMAVFDCKFLHLLKK